MFSWIKQHILCVCGVFFFLFSFWGGHNLQCTNVKYEGAAINPLALEGSQDEKCPTLAELKPSTAIQNSLKNSSGSKYKDSFN